MCRESECAPDKLTESVNQSGAGCGGAGCGCGLREWVVGAGCGSGLWVWG